MNGDCLGMFAVELNFCAPAQRVPLAAAGVNYAVIVMPQYSTLGGGVVYSTVTPAPRVKVRTLHRSNAPVVTACVRSSSAPSRTAG